MKNTFLESVLGKIEEVMGQVVYLVGGLPRDFLMGRSMEGCDIDVASSMKPDEVIAAFRAAGRKAIGKGNRFGTVFTKIDLDGVYLPVEITTFRTETYSEGSRKPQVVFSDSLEEDLSRRDFTVNSIAIRLKGSRLRVIDPNHGQEDMEARVIRAVGPPKKMFRDDPLRLFRMFRIAGKLGFDIDPATHKAAVELAHRITMLSSERIVEEMDKILSLPDPSKALQGMMEAKFFNFFIPSVQAMEGFNQHNPYHRNDLWGHTVKTIAVIPNSELDLRWAALLHDTGKVTSQTWKDASHARYIKHDLVSAVIAEQVCLYLKMSNERRNAITATVRDHQNDDCHPLFRSADWTAKR